MLNSETRDVKQIAIHLIKEFCRDNDLETTLYALEQETESDPISVPFSLLHLIQTQLEQPQKAVKREFESIGLKFDTSLPIDCKSKLTACCSLTLDQSSLKGLDIENGTFLLVGGVSRKVQLVQPETGQIVKTFDHHTSPILSLCASPKNTLVSTAMDGSCILFTVQDHVLQSFRDHTKYVTRSMFSSDGEYLITCSHDSSVCIYHDLQGKFELKEKLKFNGIVESATVYQNTLVVGVRGDNMLHYINLDDTSVENYNMNEVGDDWVSFSPMDIQVSPNEKYIAVFTDSKAGRVIVYKLKTNEIVLNLWNLDVDEFSQPRLLWHSSSNALICTSHDVIVVYDLKTGNGEKLRGHSGQVRELCFQDTDLVSCAMDSTIRVWPLSTIGR